MQLLSIYPNQVCSQNTKSQDFPRTLPCYEQKLASPLFMVDLSCHLPTGSFLSLVCSLPTNHTSNPGIIFDLFFWLVGGDNLPIDRQLPCAQTPCLFMTTSRNPPLLRCTEKSNVYGTTYVQL